MEFNFCSFLFWKWNETWWLSLVPNIASSSGRKLIGLRPIPNYCYCAAQLNSKHDVWNHSVRQAELSAARLLSTVGLAVPHLTSNDVFCCISCRCFLAIHLKWSSAKQTSSDLRRHWSRHLKPLPFFCHGTAGPNSFEFSKEVAGRLY